MKLTIFFFIFISPQSKCCVCHLKKSFSNHFLTSLFLHRSKVCYNKQRIYFWVAGSSFNKKCPFHKFCFCTSFVIVMIPSHGNCNNANIQGIPTERSKGKYELGGHTSSSMIGLSFVVQKLSPFWEYLWNSYFLFGFMTLQRYYSTQSAQI